MRGSADTARMPDVKSRRAFFRFEIGRQHQPMEMKLECAPDFSHSEMRAARSPFFGMRFGRIFSLTFLSCSPVAVFSGFDSNGRKWSAFCDLVARTRNHRAKSTTFSCGISKYPPGFFFRG